MTSEILLPSIYCSIFIIFGSNDYPYRNSISGRLSENIIMYRTKVMEPWLTTGKIPKSTDDHWDACCLPLLLRLLLQCLLILWDQMKTASRLCILHEDLKKKGVLEEKFYQWYQALPKVEKGQGRYYPCRCQLMRIRV